MGRSQTDIPDIELLYRDFKICNLAHASATLKIDVLARLCKKVILKTMRTRLMLVLALLMIYFPAQVANAATGLCGVPRTYSIGNIDSRFAVSKDTVLNDLSLAESIWETSTGRNLFSYATTSGSVRVNFVYDTRQESTVYAQATLKKINTINAAFNLIRTQFDALASSTELEQTQNSALFTAYQSDQDAYNTDVAASNAHGGATPTEYQAFTARQDALKIRFTPLKAAQDSLNERITRLNILSKLINQVTTALNSYIARYNATLGSMREYEEGEYVRSGSLQTITIYQFADNDHLVRALAHELGHSLGLEHVADKEALMYRANLGNALSTTLADIAELNTTCGF